MMDQVPKGKKVYIGARKFVQGDVLPPNLAIDLPVEKTNVKKPKRPYTRRKKD